jgi:hypothetical protein
LGGSATGGVKFPLVLGALGFVVLATSRREGTKSVSERIAHTIAVAGVSTTLALLSLALIVALGLLIIEAMTASAYQPVPTFAEAFLDAASAVGGANLTSGLVGTVTDPNLIMGLGSGINQYQYGMAWLMAAMVLGRVLPLLLIERLTNRPRPSESTPTSSTDDPSP